MKRYWLSIGLALLTIVGFAQTKSIQVMETVKVNVEVSTHFVTGDPIKYVDISMNEVVGDLPVKNILRIKPIEEKIKVKNNKGAWGEEERSFIDGQSMGIVTIVTERGMSQYQLVYTEIPQDACSQYVIPLEERTSYLNPDVSMSETDMVKFCWQVWESKPNYHDVRTKKDKMVFKLNNIYTIDDYFFFDIELVNQTKIKYDIDQVRFKIEDKKQMKRTNQQDIEVEPVTSLFDIAEFKKNYRNVYVFKKFSFSDEKVFTVEIAEKQYSGRTIKLSIDYEDILNADTFAKRNN